MALWLTFWRNEAGATAIEYASIGLFMSVLIVVGATAVGSKMKADFFNGFANLP